MAEEEVLSNGALSSEGGETAVEIHCCGGEIRKPNKRCLMSTRNLRKLAVASIICGCSCIGVLALVYAIKAREKQKAKLHDSADDWARKSQCMSILSISVLISLIVLVPLSIILISYIFSILE